MADAELTAEAKEAIRKFVWELVTPSAVVLAVFSAVVGFVVKDWALSEANSKLEDKVQAQIDSANAKLNKLYDDTNSKLTETLNEAFSVKDAMNRDSNTFKYQTQILTTDATWIEKSITTINSLTPAQLQQLNVMLQKIAAGEPEKPAPVVPAAPAVVEPATAEAAKLIQAFSTPASDKAGIGSGSSSRCPPGAYAAGIDFQTSAGGPHGIVYGGTIVCRDFPHT